MGKRLLFHCVADDLEKVGAITIRCKIKPYKPTVSKRFEYIQTRMPLYFLTINFLQEHEALR